MVGTAAVIEAQRQGGVCRRYYTQTLHPDVTPRRYTQTLHPDVTLARRTPEKTLVMQTKCIGRERGSCSEKMATYLWTPRNMSTSRPVQRTGSLEAGGSPGEQ